MTAQNNFFRKSNIDKSQFCSLLTYDDAQYLFSKSQGSFHFTLPKKQYSNIFKVPMWSWLKLTPFQ